jgi:hypothetical protein
MAWYDAADLDTITESAGLVSQWDDKSGNGYHMVQSSDPDKPSTGTRTMGTEALNALEFSGAQEMIASMGSHDAGQDLLIVMAIRKDAVGTNGQTLFDFYGGDRYFVRDDEDQSEGMKIFRQDGANPSSEVEYPYNLTVGSTDIVAVVYDHALDISSIYTNGSAIGPGLPFTGTALSNTFTNLIIGDDSTGSDNLDGVIGEIVMCNCKDSATRQKLEGYIAHKWGLV